MVIRTEEDREMAETRRVQYAAQLLTSRDVALSGVAFQAGYADQSHLTRTFRAVTGLTPELSTTGGTSDARFIKDYCPVIEFGLIGQTMHKVDENVAIADIEKLSDIYLHILEAYFDA